MPPKNLARNRIGHNNQRAVKRNNRQYEKGIKEVSPEQVDSVVPSLLTADQYDMYTI